MNNGHGDPRGVMQMTIPFGDNDADTDNHPREVVRALSPYSFVLGPGTADVTSFMGPGLLVDDP